MGSKAVDFFTPKEKEAIKLAIQNAELDTSGEIRVHVENVCAGEVLDRASHVFKQLKMNHTEQRNGVLIYLAIRNRKFAIIGDAGINKVVPSNFWDNIKHHMLTHFRNDKFADGLTEAITSVGAQMKSLFPYQKNDVNELPDDISFGEN